MLHQLRYLKQMTVLAVWYLILSMSVSVLAQSSDNRLIVLGDAAEEVQADQASLLVALSFSDEKDVALVYEQHKLARERLATALTELKVPDKDIEFSQLTTRKDRDFSMGGGGMGPPPEKFKGYQRVTIKFNDLKRCAVVQQQLSSNGFPDLNVVYSVSKQRDIELRLAEQAVGRAKEKADRLAKAISRSVKRVVRIGDVEENEPISILRANLGNPYLTNFNQDPMRTGGMPPQTFRFTALVKVVFEMD